MPHEDTFPLPPSIHPEGQADEISLSQAKDVLVIEDEEFVADATAELICRAFPGLSTTVRKTADEAVAALADRSRSWHRILLDLDVPGAYGLSLAKEVRRRGLAPVCCIFTGSRRVDFSNEAQQMGFLGYLTKSTTKEVYEGLQKVFAGERVFATLNVHAAVKHANVRLTRRQQEVLDHTRQGLGSKQISALMHLSEGTVNNYISGAVAALGANSRTHAVAKAIELGLLGMNSNEA